MNTLSHKTQIKICGIKTQEILETCIEEKINYIGFVFVEKSPRYIDKKQAKILSDQTLFSLAKVGLFVNHSINDIDDILQTVPLDILQLHGNETIDYIEKLKQKFQLPIIKAIPIQDRKDLFYIQHYIDYVDMLLFDAKPPKDSDLTGGHGTNFDWKILQHFKTQMPYMLSGGLTPQNIREAIQLTHCPIVDVSSGVESTRGMKDRQKIKDFCAAVRSI